jgi:hypothetical protein
MEFEASLFGLDFGAPKGSKLGTNMRAKTESKQCVF